MDTDPQLDVLVTAASTFKQLHERFAADNNCLAAAAQKERELNLSLGRSSIEAIADSIRTVLGKPPADERQLYALLRAMLQILNNLPGESVPLESGKHILIHGRRTWAPRGSRHEPEPGWPFPRLRLLNKDTADVIRSVSLTAAFSGISPMVQLRVGLVSLSKGFHPVFTPADHSGDGGVEILYHATAVAHESSRGLEEEIGEAIQWAINSGIHLLVFPEYSFPPEAESFLSGLPVGAAGQLRLVVAGSFSVLEAEGSSVANEGVVYIYNKGAFRRLCTHRKQIACEIPINDSQHQSLAGVSEAGRSRGATKAKERMRPDPKSTFLVTPVGVLLLGICRDCIERSSKISRAYIHADTVIIPSMNPGGDRLFLNFANDAVRACCSTLYVNAHCCVDMAKPDQRSQVELALAVIHSPGKPRANSRYAKMADYSVIPDADFPPDTVGYWRENDGVCLEIPIPRHEKA